MPNTVVKLFCADGSWGLPPVRVGRCQAMRKTPERVSFFCVERKTQKSCASKEASQTKKIGVKYEHDKKEQQEKTSKGKQRASPSETKGLFS